MSETRRERDNAVINRKILIFGSIIGIALMASLKQLIQYRKQPTSSVMKIQWKEGKSFNDIEDKDRDMCYLLSECFGIEEISPNSQMFPNDPMTVCHKYVAPYILKKFDSGFLYDSKDKLKGFLSIESEETDKYWRLNIFNVCVRKESRGKGVAKKLVNDFVKEIIKKRRSDKQVKIYVGLDIDFTTPDAISSFWLYTNSGFNSWWEGCPSTITQFDYTKLTKDLREMDVKSMEKRNEEALFEARKDKIERFCMIKVIGDDRKVNVNRPRIHKILT